MENINHSDHLGVYTVIFSEIPIKQKGYILINKSTQAQYLEAIDVSCKALIQSGADRIYATCKDKSIDVPQLELRTPHYEFHYEHELDYFEAALPTSYWGNAKEEEALQPLTRDDGDEFLHIYNDTFFHVPNSSTYTNEDTTRILEGTEKFGAGFLIKNGKKVGIYELSFEADVPEIASVGILEEYRGKGLGYQFLNLLLKSLHTKGYPKAGLRVSIANPNAYRLYENAGFVKVHTVSRWYLCHL